MVVPVGAGLGSGFAGMIQPGSPLPNSFPPSAVKARHTARCYNIQSSGEVRAMWYRVFGLSEAAVSPAELQDALRAIGRNAPFHVRSDDLGWTAIDVDLGPGVPGLRLERYLTDADEIRDDLHAWAAWLETQDNEKHNEHLMQHVIGTKQLFTLHRLMEHLAEDEMEMVCETIARTLARLSDGVYQVDTRGFFAADGKLILREGMEPEAQS
jgi:hypothetical protein